MTDGTRTPSVMLVIGLAIGLSFVSACTTKEPPPVQNPVSPRPLSRATHYPSRVLQIAARGERRRLFIYLHGFGSHAEDLRPVAMALAATFHDVESLLLDGFTPSGNGTGRQWWSVVGMNDDNRAQRIHAASVDIERWLDTELATRSLRNEDVTLLGFSQGAVLAVSVGARRSLQAVVSFCGRPMDVGEINVRTPFALLHGAQDPFIPVADATRFHEALRTHGAAVTFRVFPQLGHGIDRDAVETAREFLTSVSRASDR